MAIDPGKSGFLAVLADDEFNFYPMPTHKVPTGETLKSGKPKMKTEFNERGFRQLVLNMNEFYEGYEMHGAIEEVTGRQSWSAQNNFNFGHTAGLQRMIFIMLDVEYVTVRPQKWQAVMYQDVEKVMKKSSTGKTMVHDTKATSAKAAEKYGPGIDFKKTARSTTIDDNKTDAFLMCLWRQKQLQKDDK